MLKKILLFTGLAVSLSFTTSVNAGWERYPYLSGVWDYKLRGDTVIRWFGIRQYAQPTDYTCGATTMSMQMAWETHKKGRGLRYNPLGIHNYINFKDPKGVTSGLTAVELKVGLRKLVDYINRTQNLGVNVIMTERKDSSIKNAISTLATTMKQNFSPAILYGNVNIPPTRKGYQITPGANPGGHYYLATGVLFCPKGTCTKDIHGLFINDSAYNSPAWRVDSTIRKVAVRPRRLILEIDLKNYWRPTGSRYPWQRGHIYLYNSNPRV